MTWTNTTRGRALDLLAPLPGDIDIEEIALALGNQCRYAGCVRRFYSVAEHSVHIAAWLEWEHDDLDLTLGGLLHDAAEAYTGDITWPVQAVLWSQSEAARAAYKQAQAGLDALIAVRAGLDLERLSDPRVKDADMRILLDERAALLTRAPRPWFVDGMEPLGVDIEGWGPAEAGQRWLAVYREIQARREVVL